MKPEYLSPNHHDYQLPEGVKRSEVVRYERYKTGIVLAYLKSGKRIPVINKQ